MVDSRRLRRWIRITCCVAAMGLTSCAKKNEPPGPSEQESPKAKTSAPAAGPSQEHPLPGGPSIHDLAGAGDLAALDVQLKQGVDVNLRDASGGTALHTAAWYGQIETVQWLLDHKADRSLTNTLGQTALDLALSAGHDHAAEILMAGSAFGDAANLHRAAAAGSAGLLKALLAKKQNVNSRDDAGRTALYVASLRGHVNAVRILLAANAQIETADVRGRTPLHAAIRANQAECVTVLLEAGADPETAAASGRPPLYYAAASADAEIVRLLLDKGVSAGSAAPDVTAAQVALDWGNLDVLELLLSLP